MKRLLLVLIMVLLLSSCNAFCTTIQVDIDPMTKEEIVKESDYIVIAKSIEVTETIQNYCFSGDVPGTTFLVEVEHTFKGDEMSELTATKCGGYDKLGRFFGWHDNELTNCDAEYNLLEDGLYYLLMIEIWEDGEHILVFKELNEYDPNVEINNQSKATQEILNEYLLLEEE